MANSRMSSLPPPALDSTKTNLFPSYLIAFPCRETWECWICLEKSPSLLWRLWSLSCSKPIHVPSDHYKAMIMIKTNVNTTANLKTIPDVPSSIRPLGKVQSYVSSLIRLLLCSQSAILWTPIGSMPFNFWGYPGGWHGACIMRWEEVHVDASSSFVEVTKQNNECETPSTGHQKDQVQVQGSQLQVSVDPLIQEVDHWVSPNEPSN